MAGEQNHEETVHRIQRGTVFPTDHIPIMAARHVVDADHPVHDHEFVEIVVVNGGTGVHKTVHGERAIGAGVAFILRPGAWHAYKHCRALDVYNCYLGPELLQRELAWMFEDPLLRYLFWTGPLSGVQQGLIEIQLSTRLLGQTQVHLEAIDQLGSVNLVYARSSSIGHFLLLLGILARGVGSDHRSLRERAVRIHPAVLKGMRLLEARFHQQWTLPSLAEQVHLDRSYLARLFKSQVGLSPMAYLARLRAERAATLLLCTHRSVAEIGIEVGWPDPNYFARRFKAHFNLSPTAYRSHLGARSATTTAEKVRA